MTAVSYENKEKVSAKSLDNISTEQLKHYLETELAPFRIGNIDESPSYQAARQGGPYKGHISRYPEQFQHYMNEVNVHLGQHLRDVDITKQDIDQDVTYMKGITNIGRTCIEVFKRGVMQLSDKEVLVLGYINLVDTQAFYTMATKLADYTENPEVRLLFSKAHGHERITRCPFQGVAKTLLSFAKARRLVHLGSGTKKVVAEGVSTYFADVIEEECRDRGFLSFFISLSNS